MGLGCKKFPAGLNSSESKSEEASRKRGLALGIEFHLSTIPCNKPDTGNYSLHG